MSETLLRLSPRPIAEVLYPVGSIVVCFQCGAPRYRLQRSIYDNEPVERTLWRYAPINVADIIALMERTDLDAGQIAALKSKTLQEWATYCEQIPEVKPDSHADCHACKGQWAYGWIAGEGSAAGDNIRMGDRAFKIQLAVIPPFGRSRPVLTH